MGWCYSLEEGDQLRWVRRARAEDSIIMALVMALADDTRQLRRPWVEPRGESDETAMETN